MKVGETHDSRDGRKIEILSVSCPRAGFPVVGMCRESGAVFHYTADGKCRRDGKQGRVDLYIDGATRIMNFYDDHCTAHVDAVSAKEASDAKEAEGKVLLARKRVSYKRGEMDT